MITLDHILRDGTTAQVEAVIEAALAELKRRRALAETMEIRPDGREALETVAEACGCTVEDILGRSREERLVEARAKVIEILRGKGWSLSRIGRLLRRDHTTIQHYVRRSA